MNPHISSHVSETCGVPCFEGQKHIACKLQCLQAIGVDMVCRALWAGYLVVPVVEVIVAAYLAVDVRQAQPLGVAVVETHVVAVVVLTLERRIPIDPVVSTAG